LGRNILAIVTGYIVMFVIVMATLTGAFMVLGADRAFKPGTYDVTGLWIAVSAVLSFLAAIVGGMVAVRVGRSTHAASLLAIVVIILGVILAIPTLDAPEPGEPRTGDVSNVAAMMNAQQPPFVSFLNPVIGAVGVLIGGRVRKPSAPST
jgi:amino acid transporter